MVGYIASSFFIFGVKEMVTFSGKSPLFNQSMDMVPSTVSFCAKNKHHFALYTLSKLRCNSRCSAFYFPFHLSMKFFLCPKKKRCWGKKRLKIRLKRKGIWNARHPHIPYKLMNFRFLTWQTLFIQILIKEILLCRLKSAPTLHIRYIYPTF